MQLKFSLYAFVFQDIFFLENLMLQYIWKQIHNESMTFPEVLKFFTAE